MTRGEAEKFVDTLDKVLQLVQDIRDRIDNEYITCTICGRRKSDTPCHGVKPD